jgi:hypothetical protein
MSDNTRGPEELVEVWRFRRFDVRAGQFVTSIGKASVNAIETLGAQAIPGSMELVPLHSLDGDGIYTRARFVISPPVRRRLERLKVQYQSLLEDEDHQRLEGWSERVEALSTILRQIDETLALSPTSPSDLLSPR